jgi:hypothetical protein
MCDGSKLMTCARCKGTGKFSTGKVNGAVDWNLGACKACEGTGLRGEWQRQDVTKFANATLRIPRTGKTAAKGYLVLGPIQSFALRDFESGLTRTFDVTPDAMKDLLVLLVPRSPQQKPQKAYLVGGIVRERDVRAAVGA